MIICVYCCCDENDLVGNIFLAHFGSLVRKAVRLGGAPFSTCKVCHEVEDTQKQGKQFYFRIGSRTITSSVGI